MADVVEAPALVEITAARVQIPVVPATKMDIGVTPAEGGPKVLTRREWKTS